jgi:hypothetical protein
MEAYSLDIHAGDGKRYGPPSTAQAHDQDMFSRKFPCGVSQSAEESHPIEVFSKPRAIRLAAYHINRANLAGLRTKRIDVLHGDSLVGCGDDEATEIPDCSRTAHERREILCGNLHWDQDRMAAKPAEFRIENSGRSCLRNGITDNRKEIGAPRQRQRQACTTAV